MADSSTEAVMVGTAVPVELDTLQGEGQYGDQQVVPTPIDGVALAEGGDVTAIAVGTSVPVGIAVAVPDGQESERDFFTAEVDYKVPKVLQGRIAILDLKLWVSLFLLMFAIFGTAGAWSSIGSTAKFDNGAKITYKWTSTPWKSCLSVKGKDGSTKINEKECNTAFYIGYYGPDIASEATVLLCTFINVFLILGVVKIAFTLAKHHPYTQDPSNPEHRLSFRKKNKRSFRLMCISSLFAWIAMSVYVDTYGGFMKWFGNLDEGVSSYYYGIYDFYRLYYGAYYALQAGGCEFGSGGSGSGYGSGSGGGPDCVSDIFANYAYGWIGNLFVALISTVWLAGTYYISRDKACL